MRKILSFICFLILLFPALAGADPQADFDMAVKAEKSKDVSKAIDLYTKSAEGGNPFAQGTLGYLYQYGDGVVTPDYQRALEWNSKAAESGDVNAQVNLAIMYDDGMGLSKDHAKANELYRKAAEQGHPTAQLNLGVNYMEGKGVEQDYVKAYNILNQVRMTAPNQQARWKARSALDKLRTLMTKEQLKALKVNVKDRFSY